MNGLIALLTTFGIKRVNAAEFDSPGTHEFWVEECDDGSHLVTTGSGADGYGFFYSFAYDAGGKYPSHGCAE